MAKGLFIAVVAMLALALAGCGGGSSGPGGGGGATQARLFFTDAFDDEHASVWVTVHKIRLTRAGAGPVTVFESAAGEPVDVRSLNDGTAKFQFIAASGVPAGTYDGAEVELAKQAMLVRTGSRNGTPAEFEDALDSAGKTKIKVGFNPALVVGAGASDVVLDFVLSRWQIVNGKIRPVVERYRGGGFGDRGRHGRTELEGRVGGLTGAPPSLRFVLAGPAGGAVQVCTDANTRIYAKSGAAPTLANGQKVEVYGAFDPVLGCVLAAIVKIDDGRGGSGSGEDKVKGPLVSSNEGACEMVVRAALVRGFVPPSTEVKAVGSANTVFKNRAGAVITKSEFFAALAAGRAVEAEGTWDEGASVLRATSMELEDGPGGAHAAEARGTAVSTDLAARRAVMRLAFWTGFTARQGDELIVDFKPGATFRDRDNGSMDIAAFFGALAGGGAFEAEGVHDGQRLLASKGKLQDGAGGGGQAEATGPASSIDVDAGRFDLTVQAWFGFDGRAGQVLRVATTPTTQYRGRSGGEVLDKAQFFAQLADGVLVEAEGVLSGSTLTAKKVKLED
jgi:hypothetical protein